MNANWPNTAGSGAAARFAAHFVPCLVACLVAMFAVSVPIAHAQAVATLHGDLPDTDKRSRRVALLPLKPALTLPEGLFRPAVPRPGSLRYAVAAVTSALDGHDFVRFSDPPAVRKSLAANSGAKATFRVAQERYRLGVEYYMSMAFQRSAASMARAAQLHRDVLWDAVDPKPLADAYLIRGVSLVQQGALPAAHVAFKQMFAAQPDRTFSRRGFYGAAVDTALQRALRDEAVTGKHDRPYGDVARLHKIAANLRADALITAAIARKDGKLWLLLGFFRAEHRVFAGRLRVDITDIAQPGSRVADRIDAFVGRMLACLPIHPSKRTRKPKVDRGIWIDTSSVGGAFLRKPTRLQFYTLGFATGVEQRLRPGFAFFGRISVLTSLPDPFRDLVQTFNSLRGTAGVSFALSVGRFRFFFRPGVEVHFLGSAVATRDPGCKFFSLEHWTCNQTPQFTKSLEQDVLVGINGALGAQIAVGRGFFTTAQASSSFYFLPLDGARDLNIPVFGEIGLGYRF